MSSVKCLLCLLVLQIDCDCVYLHCKFYCDCWYLYPTCTVCHNVMLLQYGPPSLPHSLPQMQQCLQPHHGPTPCTLRNSSRPVRLFTFFAPCVFVKVQRMCSLNRPCQEWLLHGCMLWLKFIPRRPKFLPRYPKFKRPKVAPLPFIAPCPLRFMAERPLSKHNLPYGRSLLSYPPSPLRKHCLV